MTLPINADLPFREEQIAEGGKPMVTYMRELVTSLTTSHERNIANTDGSITDYTPVLTGEAAAGVGTYTAQYGQVLRQGIRTTVWFLVQWTAHTGTGILDISLPYRVKNTAAYYCFTGGIELGSIVFPGAYTYAIVKPVPNTFTARIVFCGSGLGAASLNMPASGLISGQVFYLGQEND